MQYYLLKKPTDSSELESCISRPVTAVRKGEVLLYFILIVAVIIPDDEEKGKLNCVYSCASLNFQ